MLSKIYLLSRNDNMTTGSIIMKFYFVSDFCPHCGMYFINDEDCAYHDCVFSDFS